MKTRVTIAFLCMICCLASNEDLTSEREHGVLRRIHGTMSRRAVNATIAESTVTRNVTIEEKMILATMEPPTGLTLSSEDQSIEVRFKGFGCNLVEQYWVCSHPYSIVCVFFDRSVPKADRIIATPILLPLKPKSSADIRMLDYRCNNRVQALYIRTKY